MEKYKNEQKFVYNLMINAIDNDKISHAYLFDLNDNFKAIDMIMDFVKAIIRSQDYSDASDEEFNNISKRIDDGNYIEIKVIEPDGIWIKKEQLRELQDEFSRVGIEGKTRLYIIKDADKMNVQSANSILKFLEEPVENIVAILITNNMNKMLSTIVSRCQLICFNNKIDKCYDRAYLNLINNSEVKFLNDEDECKEFVRTIIGFIDYYEENGIDAIVYSKKLWHTSFNDRDKVILAIDLMINFYYDVLLLKNDKDVIYFKDYIDAAKKVSSNNSLDKLGHKLEVLIDTKELVRYNLNLNLLFDNLVIELGGE